VTVSLHVCDALPADWDDVVRAEPPSVSRRWITLAMDRFPAGYSTFVLRAGQTALAALGGTVATSPLASQWIDPYRIFTGQAAQYGLITAGPHPWRGLPAAAVFPCALFMYPNYDLFPVGNAAADPDVLDSFVRRLRDWGRHSGLASLTFLYITAGGTPLIDALRRAGAQIASMTDSCSLDVSWNDFDGYLRMLPSRGRKMVRRELHRLAEQGVVLAEEDLDQVAADALRLRGKLLVKYGSAAAPERDTRMLAKLRALFRPAEICVVTARRAGRLLGFVLLVQDGDCWTGLLNGADYDEPSSRFTYFATGYYRPAELAPQRGVRKISYGVGSWEAKRLRGCQLSPLFAAELRLADGPLPAPPAPASPAPLTGGST
jgi:hypothetical protein